MESLWKNIQEGDMFSFEVLYKKTFPGLCQYAFQLLNDRFIAEETVQDIFLQLWETRHHVFTQGSSLNNYLYCITHNKCKDVLKKNSTQKNTFISYHPLDEWLDISEKYGFDDYIIEQIETEEMAVLIEQVVEKLPAQCREIFRLSRDDEKTNEEIATQMGLTESTVRVQLYRATQKIQKMLQSL